jgi:hypothetical protein
MKKKCYVNFQAAEIARRSDKNYIKKSNTVILRTSAPKTIQNYPKKWIYGYTDGSVFKVTTHVSYSLWVLYPDGTSDELCDSCGAFCSNYEAEHTPEKQHFCIFLQPLPTPQQKYRTLLFLLTHYQLWNLLTVTNG